MKVLVKTEIYIFFRTDPYIYIGIGRRTNGSHGTAFYLYVILTVEYEVVKSYN